MGLSAHQTSYDLLREALRGVLLAAVESGRGGGGLGSVQGRASAALYALLGDHPLDRRGRCRCCRRRGVVFGRGRRICRVYLAARFYLHQPDDMLLRRLADELDRPDLSARDAPAVSLSSGSPSGESGRPVPDHGGDRGERPERPRPRRARPDDTAPLSTALRPPGARP